MKRPSRQVSPSMDWWKLLCHPSKVGHHDPESAHVLQSETPEHGIALFWHLLLVSSPAAPLAMALRPVPTGSTYGE